MCCIYLPLQPWAVPLEMLTRNKVHSFLSGHRMFPPQPREHFFGYLLGEAWHFHRDCNTMKPKEDGGEDVGLQQEPAETLLPAGRGIPRARSMGSCHTQQLHQQKPELALDTHSKLGLFQRRSAGIHQHPSSGLFPCRAGMLQLKWGRFSYLGFHQNIPKEPPRQRQAGKIQYNHRQQMGIKRPNKPVLRVLHFSPSSGVAEQNSVTPVTPFSPHRVALAPLG